jgi:hypothetical protein
VIWGFALQIVSFLGREVCGFLDGVCAISRVRQRHERFHRH